MPQKNFTVEAQFRVEFERFCSENGYTEVAVFKAAAAQFAATPHEERVRWFRKVEDGGDLLDGINPRRQPAARGKKKDESA